MIKVSYCLADVDKVVGDTFRVGAKREIMCTYVRRASAVRKTFDVIL